MLFDKRLLTPCPVLTPTDQEFNDPVGYLSSDKVSKLGATYGLVKIVPPPNWKPSFHINPDFKFHVRKQVLSDLGITTRSRDFFRENTTMICIEKLKILVNQWIKKNGKS